MKRIVFAPAALASFDDLLAYTVDRFGLAQAEEYTEQLIARLEALASGSSPRARPCEVLMRNVRDASGLTYYREGGHYLILRDLPDRLDVVEILHARMDLDTHLKRLVKDD